ncbi:MAG: protein kinase [Blastocatellia bacterium]
MMTSEQWKKVRDLFDAVATLDAPARTARLAQSGESVEVQAAVVQLLREQEKLADFLETPAPLLVQHEFEDRVTQASGRRIGPYLIESEIGRGGMGIVYRAVRVDDAYQKQVAVKLVWPGLSASEMAHRFRRERQILANLEHAGIARLLDGGVTSEGWQYLVMEYVAGQPITDYCDQHRLSIAQRLRLFREVCAAVEYAHQNLVIHRDLKPGNILVTASGQVKLIDFGIATFLDQHHQPVPYSVPGTAILTPEYASPEQLQARLVTTTSDVYSLGVVLYELLTGHRPHYFRHLSPEAAARRIAEAAPALPSRVIEQITEDQDQDGQHFVTRSPRMVSEVREGSPERLRRALKGDLDNIVLKALRSNPADRYHSVAQLSEDLARHLNGEPVTARKPEFTYLAGRFMRKHKPAVLAGVVILLTLLTALLLLIRQNRSEREKARLQRRALYAAQMQEALQFWKDDEWRKMNQRLEAWLPQPGEEDLRGFEWHYLQRLVNGSGLTLKLPNLAVNTALSADGQVLIVVDAENGLKTFDVTTGRELLSLPGRSAGWTRIDSYSSPELVVRVYEGRRVVVQDWLTGEQRAEFTEPEGGLQWAQARKQDQLLTINDKGTIKIREISTGRILHLIEGDGRAISAFAVSKDQQRLAAVSHEQRQMTIHDLAGNRPPVRFEMSHEVISIGWTAQEQWLLAEVGNELLAYDPATGRLARKLTHAGRNITAFFLSPDSRRMATIDSRNGVAVWDTVSLRRLFTLPGLSDAQILNLYEDGQWLTIIHNDRRISLWNLNTRREMVVFRGQRNDLLSAYVSHDNRWLTISSTDHTVRVWNLAEAMQPDVLRGHTSHILTATFSPDGRHVVTAGKDRRAIIHDITSGAQTVLRGHQDYIYTAAYSPDGRMLATGSNDGTLKLWDTATGREVTTIRNGTTEYYSGVRALTYTRDGRQIVAGLNDGKIRIWDAASHQLLHEFKAHAREVLSVSFSPDGRLLASGSWDQTAKLWDAANWQELSTLKGHTGYVWSAVFSPDGRQLATGSQDQTVKLWGVATHQLIRTLASHNDEIFSVAFTPDGTRLATASNDHTVRLWNPATGQELLTLRDHTDEVWAVAFSPDGSTMLTASWDKTARIWRSNSREPLNKKLISP